MTFSYLYVIEIAVFSDGDCVAAGHGVLVAFWKIGPVVVLALPYQFFVECAIEHEGGFEDFFNGIGIGEHGFGARLGRADWTDGRIWLCFLIYFTGAEKLLPIFDVDVDVYFETNLELGQRDCFL